MSVELSLEIDSSAATAMLGGIEAQIRGPVLEVAGRVMLNYFKDYHTEFRPRWKGSHYMAGNNAGRWSTDIVAGWQNPVKKSEDSVSVINIHPHLAHKIQGGPIVPKRGKFLTIPLIPEAKGRMAGEFATSLGVKLFRLGNTLAYRGPNGAPIGAYALSKGVQQDPWPGAMPSDDAIQERFAYALAEAMDSLNQ
jgi:hypothetical protein